MSYPCPLLLARGVLAILFLFAGADRAFAGERAQAPSHVLRAHPFSAGTKIALRPEFDQPRPKTATLQVTYVGFPVAAQAAFQRAVDIWETLITSPVPINIRAAWEPLGTGILGGAGSNFINRDFLGAPMPGTWYVDALADALAGSDLGGGGFDIFASFNSTFNNWYFGTDGNPDATEFDLVTVVLHEIGHGLGMTGSMFGDLLGIGTWGFGLPPMPMIYDVFAETLAGTPLLDPISFPNPSFALGTALEDRVFFDGPMAVAAHGGNRPELYAPDPFLQGSSFSHFDESLFPFGTENGLMTPFLAMDEVIHDPGDVALCLLEDLGWQTEGQCGMVPPPPNSCLPTATTICLRDGRFAVEVDWVKFDGEEGVARLVTQSDDSTLMYFFNPSNWEMLIKVLDNCSGETNRFWVFAGATTNVEYTLRVTDTQAGVVRSYFNPLGVDASAITDTDAFETCP